MVMAGTSSSKRQRISGSEEIRKKKKCETTINNMLEPPASLPHHYSNEMTSAVSDNRSTNSTGQLERMILHVTAVFNLFCRHHTILPDTHDKQLFNAMVAVHKASNRPADLQTILCRGGGGRVLLQYMATILIHLDNNVPYILQCSSFFLNVARANPASIPNGVVERLIAMMGRCNPMDGAEHLFAQHAMQTIGTMANKNVETSLALMRMEGFRAGLLHCLRGDPRLLQSGSGTSGGGGEPPGQNTFIAAKLLAMVLQPLSKKNTSTKGGVTYLKQMPLSHLETFVPFLLAHLNMAATTPSEFIAGAAESLNIISKHSEEACAMLVKRGSAPKLVGVLALPIEEDNAPHTSFALLNEIVPCMVNISACDLSELTLSMIHSEGFKHGVLQGLRVVTNRTKKRHVKNLLKNELLLLLSNVAAETPNVIAAVFRDNEELWNLLFRCFDNFPFQVQEKVLFTIGNVVQLGFTREKVYMLEKGGMERLTKLVIKSKEVTNSGLLLTLSALDRAFPLDAEMGTDFLEAFHLAGGIDGLEKLELHPNQKVGAAAKLLIEKWFPEVEENITYPVLNVTKAENNGALPPPRRLFPLAESSQGKQY